jgi:hypothetical protein
MQFYKSKMLCVQTFAGETKKKGPRCRISIMLEYILTVSLKFNG